MNNLHCETSYEEFNSYDNDALLNTALLHGICRRTPAIWKTLVNDLLVDRTATELAKQLHVSSRTLSRIAHDETQKPKLQTSLELLLMYVARYPKRLSKLLKSSTKH